MTEKETIDKRRPFGLYIIIGLQLAIAIFLALVLLGQERIDPYIRVLIQNPLFYSWFGWVLVGSLLLAIFGLLRLKRWGWILTMILTGIGLSFSIWSYFQGKPYFIDMVIYLVIVFYLNQRDVQSPFMREYSPGGVR